VVHGSANLVQTLLAANLVDQLNLLVYPLVLGKGQRLFPGGIKAGFKLVEATPVDTGVIISMYERIEE
jgi:dihydrofolate reductase